MRLPYEIDADKFDLVLRDGLRKMFCTEQEVALGMDAITAYVLGIMKITGVSRNEVITSILFGHLMESILKLGPKEIIGLKIHKELHDREKRESDARRN